MRRPKRRMRHCASVRSGSAWVDASAWQAAWHDGRRRRLYSPGPSGQSWAEPRYRHFTGTDPNRIQTPTGPVRLRAHRLGAHAWGDLGYDRRRRGLGLCGRTGETENSHCALAAGFAGAVLGTIAFDLIGAAVFPLASTAEPISTTWPSRLLARMLVAVGTAAIIMVSLSSALPRGPRRSRRQAKRSHFTINGEFASSDIVAWVFDPGRPHSGHLQTVAKASDSDLACPSLHDMPMRQDIAHLEHLVDDLIDTGLHR